MKILSFIITELKSELVILWLLFKSEILKVGE